MQTEFIKLAVIFIVIMVMVLAKLKLRDAMIAAILLTVILFGIPLGDAAKLMIQSVYEKDTLLVVGSFILVTFFAADYGEPETSGKSGDGTAEA